jgi:hypothetical protein
MTPRDYTLEIREDGERMDRRPIEDPFINTTITVRGWRSAWAVLRRGVTLNLILDGSRETIAHVMSGADPKVAGPVAEATSSPVSVNSPFGI